MCFSRSCVSSSTSTCTGVPANRAFARSASTAGVRTLGGSWATARATLAASPSTDPSATASASDSAPPVGDDDGRLNAGRRACGRVVLYASTWKAARVRPSARARTVASSCSGPCATIATRPCPRVRVGQASSGSQPTRDVGGGARGRPTAEQQHPPGRHPVRAQPMLLVGFALQFLRAAQRDHSLRHVVWKIEGWWGPCRQRRGSPDTSASTLAVGPTTRRSVGVV